MRSTVDVAAECLTDVLPLLQAAATIVGSQPGPGNVVRLIIEGDAVPHAPKVDCSVAKTTAEGKVTIEIIFTPLPEGAVSDVEIFHGEGVGLPIGILDRA